MLIFQDRKFIRTPFDNEDEIERVVVDNYEFLFGPNSIYLPKTLIKTSDGSGVIPDGFAIDLGSRKWYLVEAELIHHSVWTYIAPQVSKQIIATQQTISKKRLEDLAVEQFQAVETINEKFSDFAIKEIDIRKVLGEILEKEPTVGVPIDHLTNTFSKPAIANSQALATISFMKLLLLTILTLTTLSGLGQTSYKGFIDKYPIQLITYIYSDGDARAIYAYDKHDTPIIINGRQKADQLELLEKNEKGQIEARLVFKNFDPTSNKIIGEWISTDSTKTLKISLTKQFEINYEDRTIWSNQEIIQRTSTHKHYFKLLISKESADENVRVTGVKIFEKKTDKLIQKIDLDCQLWGLENISVGDYNFDGIEDFSVFEASYAGPNTSSIYILKLPNSDKYFVSDFSGVSLEFDSGQIFERNQCCAGRSVMTATYKVVDNKMVLIEKECIEYDDEKEDFVKKKCD